jgi:hypothetical protein
MRRYTPVQQLIAVSLGLLAASCATIMRGSTQDVGIASSPTGARVTVDNQPRGTTPVILPHAGGHQRDPDAAARSAPGGEPRAPGGGAEPGDDRTPDALKATGTTVAG